MESKDIIKALDRADVFIRGRVEANDPLNEYDVGILIEIAKSCDEATNYIKNQQAEINRLKELLEEWKTEAYKIADEKDELYCNAVERVTIARNEAYKEYTRKLLALIGSVELSNLDLRRHINNLANELTERKED